MKGGIVSSSSGIESVVVPYKENPYTPRSLFRQKKF